MPVKDRKVIQIATSSAQVDIGVVVHKIVALCNDGTMWETPDYENWYAISPVPQPESSTAKD